MAVVCLTEQEKLAKANEVGAEDEEEEGDDDIEDDDEDLGSGQDSDDVEGETEDQYLARLEKAARDIIDGNEEGESEDDDGFNFFSDDEEVQSPLDNIDPFIQLVDIMSQMQHVLPARHAALMASLDAAAQTNLSSLCALAETERQKKVAIALRQAS